MPHAVLHWLRPFVIAALCVGSLPAFATAQRTFVASSGNDAAACSITAPCRSFAAAIAQTNAGGEVIVQDSAGYGAVTITKSVSIIAPPGIYGGISVFSGSGILINASNVEVVLRGLTINGQGGVNGIDFLQGTKLTVEECEIANMSVGIRAVAVSSTVTVKNTVVRDNSGAGVSAGAGSRVTIANSVLANNVDVGVHVSASSATVTDVMVTRSTITGSAIGLAVSAASGATARLVSDGNAINNASFAAFLFLGGAGTETIYTSGNNTVGFNNQIVFGGALTPIGMH